MLFSGSVLARPVLWFWVPLGLEGCRGLGGGGREAATVLGHLCRHVRKLLGVACPVLWYIPYMCCLCGCVYHVKSCAKRGEAEILSDDSTLSSRLKLQLD